MQEPLRTPLVAMYQKSDKVKFYVFRHIICRICKSFTIKFWNLKTILIPFRTINIFYRPKMWVWPFRPLLREPGLLESYQKTNYRARYFQGRKTSRFSCLNYLRIRLLKRCVDIGSLCYRSRALHLLGQTLQALLIDKVSNYIEQFGVK